MKIAYFDCFSGVSGDMILGALIDAGLELRELEAELDKLKLSGYKLSAEKVIRAGISGTKFSMEITEQSGERRLKDITQLIDQSSLDSDIKTLGKRVFQELATVEAEIHGKDAAEIHFHEAGGLDSIIDVIGSLVAIKKLGIEAVYASKIHLGTGFVQCRHGMLPVPAPATLALLKGVPIRSQGIEAELATPTGVSLLRTLARSFGTMPEMRLEKVGYGAGSRELEIPNLLRVYIGEADEGEYERDEVILMETNLDDTSPELLAHASEVLLKQGALDVFMTPIFMKKNRPGTMLSVLTTPDKLDMLLATIFNEIATLGVRLHHLERRKLSREVISVETRFGEIKVKIGRLENKVKAISPEYESCREIALKLGIPLKEVYDEAKEMARKALSGEKST